MMHFRTFHKQTRARAIRNTVRETIESPAPPHKSYERYKQIVLPAPTSINMPLGDALEQRESVRDFDPGKPLSVQQIGTLLHATAGSPKASRRAPSRLYPTGGALQTIEHYVLICNVSGIETGVYHYAHERHTLEQMSAPRNRSDFNALWQDLSPISTPAAVICYSAVWGRSYHKYGNFAYRLALAEAGHSAQNTLLACAALGMQACPIMGFDEHALASLLDIENDTEDPLYMVCVGL